MNTLGLEVSQATVKFDDHVALNKVSLRVQIGECLAILGPSGSGKSTLLRVIAGLLRPSAGVLRWNGVDITSIVPEKRSFGMMFQESALFPHRNVAGNIAFGLEVQRTPRLERDARVSELLNLMQLSHLAHRNVNTLSGGEKQRVALARALAPSPRLLLLDEPFGALDKLLRMQLVSELQQILLRTKTTAIVVTHDHEEAFSLGNNIGVMHHGQIVQMGETSNVLARPKNAYIARFFGYPEPVAVSCEEGILHMPWASEKLPGSFASNVKYMLVPPHAVSLEGGALPAVVTQRTYRGWNIVLSVCVAGVTLQCLCRPPGPRVGDQVNVSIDVHQLIDFTSAKQ